MLEPGTKLDDRYVVDRLIGRGAMANVYRVRHLGLHSTHALKVLNPDLAQREDLRNRFLSEGRIQAQLRHPNIVQVTEIVTATVAGLVMDFVDGPNLAGHVRKRLQELPPSNLTPGLPLPEVQSLLLPVLDAVDLAHASGVVHRDLKPENILVGRDARNRLVPMVTDFGIAKVLERTAVAGQRTQTEAGVRIGTPLYMSPEQIRGATDLDGRSDVFALGAILYEIATGKIAFDAPSDFDTLKKIVDGDFVPPERVVGALSPMLAACIRTALASDPRERFQDCAAFRAALERAGDAFAPLPLRPARSFATTWPPAPDPSAVPLVEILSTVAVAQAPPPASPFPATPSPVPAVQEAKPLLHDEAAVPKDPSKIAPDRSTSPGLATFLSFLCIPGLGQAYNLQFGKAAAIFLGCVALAVYTDGWSYPLTYMLLAVDAYAIAAKRHSLLPVGRWECF
jgi:serine/threonine-protein kinase